MEFRRRHSESAGGARDPAADQRPDDGVRAVLHRGLFAAVLSKAFKKIRPIFRERGKINAEVQGRLTESLAGVRVVKGYHAEEEEARVFSGGVQRSKRAAIRAANFSA